MPSSHLILYRPLLFLPSIFPSIMDFSNESAVHFRRPKYWSFSFSIGPSNDYSGFISLKTDCFDLLAVQGALGCLLQNQCSKASILRHSAFFMVHLSQSYKTTGKTTALIIQSFVIRVMFLLFNTTVYVCHSFPAEKKTSSDFMAAVTICSDFRAQEEEICHYFHLFPFYLPWSNGAGCHDLSLFGI